MIKFRLYREYGALNSPDIFNALEAGIIRNGYQITDRDEDIPVIWSALWHGRMQNNQRIYQKFKSLGKSILIIEVGNLHRGKTWRISFNNVNKNGIFADDRELDLDRPKKLKLDIKPPKIKRKPHILIAVQHEKSLQWEGQPKSSVWVENKIREIRRFTDRPIVVRSHPRSPLNTVFSSKGVEVKIPMRIEGTYDDFDIDYDCHCVVNHNSGPGIQAAIHGTPIICDPSSLAYDVSSPLKDVEDIALPPREDWFVKLCHTEWTVEEIAQGIPLKRLLKI
jgi:hypothetical protein